MIVDGFGVFFVVACALVHFANLVDMPAWTPVLPPGLQFFRKKIWFLACWPLLGLSWEGWEFTAPFVSPKVVEWATEKRHDFGEIPVGRAVIHVFRFKNTSPDTILLQTVRTTCGCTAVRYPETPIAPGAIGDLTVEYDAAQSGHFAKKIRVFFDRQRKPDILWIEGEVR